MFGTLMFPVNMYNDWVSSTMVDVTIEDKINGLSIAMWNQL